MAAIILITMLFYRATSRSTSTKKAPQRKPQQQRKNSAAKAKTAQPSDKEQALLQELLDLDKAFEAGKLTKKVYQERRAKTKARLRAIMREKVTP